MGRKRIFLFILLAGLMILSSFRADLSEDLDADGINDNVVINESLLQNAAVDSAVSIAVVQSGSWLVPTLNRLAKLGYNNVTEISPLAGLDTLSLYDIVIIPSTWAGTSGNATDIMARDSAYLDYVDSGGALLICQPNPNGTGTVQVTLLPEPVTFYFYYNSSDFPKIADSTHSITSGLPSEGMPFPADTISVLPEMYHVLVKGSVSGSPSLFIGNYGSGRLMVDCLGFSESASFPLSDTVVVRMIEWLDNGSPQVVNKPPVAKNDSTTTYANIAVSIDVLENDTDPEGSGLKIDTLMQPLHGAAALHTEKDNQLIEYMPDSTFSGLDSFLYVIKDAHGLYDTASVFITVQILTALNEDLSGPENYHLFQNFPNPFNPVTAIRYSLPLGSHVKLEIYNLAGQKVVTLVDTKQAAGSYAIEWDATSLSSAVYFCRIETSSGYSRTRKMVLIK